VPEAAAHTDIGSGHTFAAAAAAAELGLGLGLEHGLDLGPVQRTPSEMVATQTFAHAIAPSSDNSRPVDAPEDNPGMHNVLPAPSPQYIAAAVAEPAVVLVDVAAAAAAADNKGAGAPMSLRWPNNRSHAHGAICVPPRLAMAEGAEPSRPAAAGEEEEVAAVVAAGAVAVRYHLHCQPSDAIASL